MRFEGYESIRIPDASLFTIAPSHVIITPVRARARLSVDVAEVFAELRTARAMTPATIAQAHGSRNSTRARAHAHARGDRTFGCTVLPLSVQMRFEMNWGSRKRAKNIVSACGRHCRIYAPPKRQEAMRAVVSGGRTHPAIRRRRLVKHGS